MTTFFVALDRSSTAGVSTRWRIKSYLVADARRVQQSVLMTTNVLSAAVGIVRQVGVQIVIYNQPGQTAVLSDEARHAITEWANAGPGSLVLSVEG